MTTEVFVFGNNIDTTLTSGINASVTTIPVASVAGFPTIPSGQYFALTLIHPPTPGVFEIVYVTSVSGLNLTVLRGQEGSTAASWAINDTIFSDVTQGILQNFNTIIQENLFCVAGADSGTTNTYVVALTPPITAYTDGMKVSFRPANSNSGNSTLDAGAGAKAIVMGGNALQGSELLATTVVEVQYDATNTQWRLGSGYICAQVTTATHSGQATNLAQTFGSAAPSNVTSSRAMGTVYTNSYGRPIFVLVQLSMSSGSNSTINIAGATYNYIYGIGTYVTAGFVVPKGATYQLTIVSGTITVGNWTEI